MPTIQYPNHPNTDTVFVVQDDGTKNRALMTAPQDTSTLELPKNANSCKGYVTINGKKQRVVLTVDATGGSSGGDQHNLGWYATQSDLETAHATAEAGDWAIVGSTDTVWIWDTDTSAWKDSDQKGQVTSVNGQTGTVVLTASDVDAVPQLSTLPTASADNVGDIVQFVGTTTASYTNGYFYKCVSDGQNPATYSWEAVEVQASSGGVSDVTVNGTSVVSGGVATITGMVQNFGNAGNNGFGISAMIYSAIATGGNSIAIGNDTRATDLGSIAIGYESKSTAMHALSIGLGSQATQSWGIGIGTGAIAGAQSAIQLGGFYKTNSDANTFKVGNDNGNFEMMSADGTIPAARHAALPSADGTYVLKLVIASGVPTLSWVAE